MLMVAVYCVFLHPCSIHMFCLPKCFREMHKYYFILYIGLGCICTGGTSLTIWRLVSKAWCSPSLVCPTLGEALQCCLFDVLVQLVMRARDALMDDTSRGIEVAREHRTRSTPHLAGYRPFLRPNQEGKQPHCSLLVE